MKIYFKELAKMPEEITMDFDDWSDLLFS